MKPLILKEGKERGRETEGGRERERENEHIHIVYILT